MKMFSFFCVCSIMLFFSCKKNDFIKNTDIREGYIIGFDQCTAGLQTFEGKGFVILDNDSKKAYLTYNLPDTLYQFPSSHFSNRKLSYLFPDSVKKKYRAYFSFEEVEEKDKLYFICTADVLFSDFISDVEDKQIKILKIYK